MKVKNLTTVSGSGSSFFRTGLFLSLRFFLSCRMLNRSSTVSSFSLPLLSVWQVEIRQRPSARNSKNHRLHLLFNFYWSVYSLNDNQMPTWAVISCHTPECLQVAAQMRRKPVRWLQNSFTSVLGWDHLPDLSDVTLTYYIILNL